MVLAIAALIFQTYLPSPVAFSAEKFAINQPTEVADTSADSTEVASLVVAPVPNMEPTPRPADPEPYISSEALRKNTISVEELRAETQRTQHMWLGLSIIEHGSASFDAASTRYAISQQGGHELNPLLKPFAGNASIYVAIQVGPAMMDYVAKKMIYSQHSWVRRMWWVPQSASTVSSLFCGAHNMGVRSPGN
jgi:hypothetical protein